MNNWTSCVAILVVFVAAAGPTLAQVKQAERALKNGEFEVALDHIEEALADNPDDAKALELHGRILIGKSASVVDAEEHADLLGKAVESLKAAIAKEPKRTDDVRKQVLIAYLEEVRQGVQAYTAAQQSGGVDGYLSAAAFFRGATVLAPDSTDSYVNWAFSLMNADRGEEAIAPLEMAISRGGNDADAHKYLANLYLTNDRAADAVTLLEKSTATFPDNGDLRAQLLNAYVISGQTDRASDYYGKVIEEEPDNKVFRYNYGSLLLEAERYDEAIEQLTAAVSLDPEYAEAHYNLGAAYVNKAIAINDEIGDIDDGLRERRSEMTPEAIAEAEASTETLTAERTELFGLATGPLEAARSLYGAAGADTEPICQLLFQSYVQSNQMERATEVQDCAGYGE